MKNWTFKQGTDEFVGKYVMGYMKDTALFLISSMYGFSKFVLDTDGFFNNLIKHDSLDIEKYEDIRLYRRINGKNCVVRYDNKICGRCESWLRSWENKCSRCNTPLTGSEKYLIEEKNFTF